MSCDETEVLGHLDWIDDLCDSFSTNCTTRPRYEKSIERIDDIKVVAWWEFYCNENNLDEWDEEVQYYEEERDTFRKWTNTHKLDFETISMLRSLRLDDTIALQSINHYQWAVLQTTQNYGKLARAINSLSPAPTRAGYDDDTFGDDSTVTVDDKEFNLRPRLTRNLPLRRSTRSGKRKEVQIPRYIRTVGPGATRQRDLNSRRLSWETFTFFNPSKPHATVGPRTPPMINKSRPLEKSFTSPSPRARQRIEHFKFPEKKDTKLTTKKNKTYFPSVTPI